MSILCFTHHSISVGTPHPDPNFGHLEILLKISIYHQKNRPWKIQNIRKSYSFAGLR